MTGKIKSQHILFRSFIPAPYELYALQDQVICLFAAHSTQILFHDAEFVLCNKMGDLLWTRLRFKLGLLESLVRFLTSYVFSPDSQELTCQFLWSIIATYAMGEIMIEPDRDSNLHGFSAALASNIFGTADRIGFTITVTIHWSMLGFFL